MTLEELLAVAEIVEKLTNRYRDQEAAHKAALTEIRASFNARTSADGKRHEGILDTYRSELDEIDAALNPALKESTALVAKRLVEERDALRAEVADLRGTLDIVHASLGIKPGDHIGKAIEALKAQAPKRHPVEVGEWVKAPLGTRGKVVSLGRGYLEVELPNERPTRWWPIHMCEPCDPPEASHDTTAGKEAAEAVIRDSQMTEIKVGTTLRLCKAPKPEPQLSGLVDFPWNEEWGSVGDVAEVINTLNPASLPAVAVRLESELVVWWPRSCIEIVRKVTQ